MVSGRATSVSFTTCLLTMQTHGVVTRHKGTGSSTSSATMQIIVIAGGREGVDEFNLSSVLGEFESRGIPAVEWIGGHLGGLAQCL